MLFAFGTVVSARMYRYSQRLGHVGQCFVTSGRAGACVHHCMPWVDFLTQGTCNQPKMTIHRKHKQLFYQKDTFSNNYTTIRLLSVLYQPPNSIL
jgi:hypothetical protein